MSKPTKLHPLHTPEWVSQVLYETGCYPGDRRTGKTTAAILVAVGTAMQEPGRRVQVQDPDLKPGAKHQLYKMVQQYGEDVVRRQGLEHLHFAISPGTDGAEYRLTVEFFRR